MSIQAVGLKAYTQALNNFTKARNESAASKIDNSPKAREFAEVLQSSLHKVNTMQSDRSKMIMSFAAGETQNVHELMISMQKASLAMNMTTAVRNKAMEAYKELSRLQF